MEDKANTSEAIPAAASPTPSITSNEDTGPLPGDFESTTERLEKIKERFNQQLLLRKQSSTATPSLETCNDGPSVFDRVMNEKEWASPILEENERALAASIIKRKSDAPKKDFIHENINIKEGSKDIIHNKIPTLTSPVSTSVTSSISPSSASLGITGPPSSEDNETAPILEPRFRVNSAVKTRPVSLAIDSLVAAVPDEDPNVECEHRKFIDPTGPSTCLKCKTKIAPIARLHAERDGLYYKLETSKKRLDEASKREVQIEQEYEMQVITVKELQKALESKEIEVVAVRRDMQIMGEKLVDEIEKRAEMQHSKETFQDELEDLTKKLFEEANTLVSDEARKRHHYEMRVASLEKQLDDIRQELQTAHEQLFELKSKMERYLISKEASQEDFDEFEIESAPSTPMGENASNTWEVSKSEISLQNANSGIGNNLRSSTPTPSVTSNATTTTSSPLRHNSEKWVINESFSDIIDPILFAEFHDFLIQPPNAKLSKIAFIRNALEDDIEPCLKFGGNPRTSTKKLVDAMLINSVFVEAIPKAEIEAEEERERRAREVWYAQEVARIEHQAKVESAIRAAEAGLSTDTNGHHPNMAVSSILPVQVAPPNVPGVIPLSTSPQPRPDTPSTTSSITSSLLRGLTNPRTAIESDHPIPLAAPGLAPQLSSKGTKAIFNKTIWERMSAGTLTGTRSTTTPSTVSNVHLVEGFILPTCMTCGRQSRCRYRFKITDSTEDAWVPTCIHCRDRIVAACDFYEFVRYVRSGLYRGRKPEEVYLESLAIKRRMFFARIGAAHYAKVERGLGKIKFGKLLNKSSSLSNTLSTRSNDSSIKAERPLSVASSTELRDTSPDASEGPLSENIIKTNVELGPDGLPKMSLSPLIQKSLLD